MSDTSQGPGWWRASDGLWYPPEAKPGPRRDPDDADSSARRPPGVPERAPADPKIQQPFTPRKVEPIELERERQGGGRRISPGWIAVALLVLLFGGVGSWLALTARGEGTDEANAPTTAPPSTAPATSETTAPSSSTSSTTPGQVSVFDLDVGDCFTAEPTDGTGEPVVTVVRLVECDDPHLAEVVHVGDLDAGPDDPFPGIDARDEAAQEMCQPAFESYVGIELAASDLGLLWLAPSEESWDEEGDRGVTCAVQTLDGTPLTATVRDSGR